MATPDFGLFQPQVGTLPAEKKPAPLARQPERLLNPKSFEVLRNRWQNWISVPENRAFLIQTGINLAQPAPVGQSRLGHITSALGGGLEARDRNIAARQATEAAETAAAQETRRLDLQEAQVDVNMLNAEAVRANAGNTFEGFVRFMVEGLIPEAVANAPLTGQDPTDAALAAAATIPGLIPTLEDIWGQIQAVGGPSDVSAAQPPVSPTIGSGPTPEQLQRIAVHYQQQGLTPQAQPAITIDDVNFRWNGQAWVRE